MAPTTGIPSEAPPPYSEGPSNPNTSSSSSNHLSVPTDTSNGISAAQRRSMEDESRPLPTGWVRTFDPETAHQFFVDTTKDPPRSIWTHPYDDDEYLGTLSSEERERIEADTMNGHRGRHPSREDIIADHTDEEDQRTELPPRPAKGSQAEPSGAKGFGRRLKDKLTGTTHEQRNQERAKRAEQEREAYRRHMELRKAMARAMQTGEPQLIGRDKQGQDVYLQPPTYGGRAGGMYGGGRMYDPYGGGMYAAPNARYIRPAAPYGRPYGYGYGRGMGMPLGLGLGGGLLGGAMLGGMMGGGFGGGMDGGGGDGGGGGE